MSKEAKLVRTEKKMESTLETSHENQDKLDVSVKKMKQLVLDDLDTFKSEVLEKNKQLSDDIDAIPPTVGETGPRGPPGVDGKYGGDGATGRVGLQGQQGKRGPSGERGPVGKEGPLGRRGDRGKIGILGPKGAVGHIGEIGAEGVDGQNAKWKKDQYYCPGGQTDTMRLTDCTKTGCRLETIFENEWGSICSSGFTEQSADTVCKALGFWEGGELQKDFGGGTGPIWLTDVACKGGEGDVGDCPHEPWLENRCDHAQDVGLCCNGNPPTGSKGTRQGPSFFPRCPGKQRKDMRLVDCNKEVCRLEVLHNEEWGTVCDNGFTDLNAKTVCRMFGYEKGKFKQMCSTNGRFGSCESNRAGTGPIWLDDVVCSGIETELEGCRHRAWGDHRCTHKQDVGLCCSGDEVGVYHSPPVRGGAMIFKFNENLESSTGGAALTAPWGGAFAGVEGFHFREGQGLAVDPGGFMDGTEWTIYMRVKLDQVLGKRVMIRSNGWGENGFLVDGGRFVAIPNNENGTLACDIDVTPDTWYQYVVSKSKSDEVRIYVNGALCGQGRSDEPGTFNLNPDEITLLADSGTRNPSGYVNKISLYPKEISEQKVAKICGCKLPQVDTACERTIIVNPPDFGMKYSSVREAGWSQCALENQQCNCDGSVRIGLGNSWGEEKAVYGSIQCTTTNLGDPVPGVQKRCQCKPSNQFGSGFSAGRLNSAQGWTPSSTQEQWMQMDAGMTQSISGIVTQGRRDANEWVTKFTVKVSADGRTWRDVGCGRYYYANSDRNTKKKTMFHHPVHARYIRIYPIEWSGGLSMRAGVMVCERPCVDGNMNYFFGLTFMSSTGGPSLDPFWGEGTFTEVMQGNKPTMVYKFQPGQGLQLDPERCLKKSIEWTVLIDVRLDQVSGGYRKILGSLGWGDYGLYVNKYLMLVPQAARMVCQETIRTSKFYQFVMSRDAAGQIKLYINGGLCAVGTPAFKDHYQLNPSNMLFMKDDADENAGGELKVIRVWDKALEDEDVEAICGCSKPDPGEKCRFTVGFLPPSSKASYSSVRNDDRRGSGFARGRLGSPLGWVSKIAESGQYMQIDTGMVQSIVGVITQGRKDEDEWVLTYTVKVSDDGSDWHEVGCSREFDGNTDSNTKVKAIFAEPVQGRFVRIYPQTWHGWMSMRSGLLICEKPCIEKRLDYNFPGVFSSRTFGPSLDPAWGDGVFTPLDGYRFSSGQGFELDASRCLKKPTGWTAVIRAKLDNVDGPRALMTSYSWGDDYGLYVDRYLKLLPDGANMQCDDVRIQPNTLYDFAITRSALGNITLYVNGEPCARGAPPFKDYYALVNNDIEFLRDDKGRDSAGNVKSIRLWDKSMTDHEAAGECGCLLPVVSSTPCDKTIIFSPSYKQLIMSSVKNDDKIGQGFARGRLNSRQAWTAKRNSAGEWLQIDSGMVQTIKGVVTQGRIDRAEWVQSYSVKVSQDGTAWKDVRCQRPFTANTDKDTKVTAVFPEPVVARYVRIYPQTYNGAMSLRAGVVICMLDCKGGVLDYNMAKGSLLSQTDGDALIAPWGAGYFDGDNGYRFAEGEGLELDQDAEGCMNDHLPGINSTNANSAYTIMMKVKLDQTTGWRKLVGSRGWGDYGLFVNQRLQMFPPGANLKCKETILPDKWYRFGITRAADGVVALYINGVRCSHGRPPFVRNFMLDQNNIKFFHDDGEGQQNSGGFLNSLRVMNRALTREEMASEIGCRLTEDAARCERTIVFGPLPSQMSFSSVTNNDRPGIGHGRGRLNSPAGWVPANAVAGTDFMQVDTGEIQSIAGVVTQGNRESQAWVTSFTVQVSLDNIEWISVSCSEVFDANEDQNTKVKTLFRRPVRGRYVRIFPETWQQLPSLRAGVLICERPCVGGLLDYRFQMNFLSKSKGPSLDPAWGEGEFMNAAVGYRFENGQGLMVDEGNCITTPNNYTVLIDVKLDQTSGDFRKLFGSDTWGNYGLYVNQKMQLFPAAAQMQCRESIDDRKYYRYMMSRDVDGTVRLYLNGYKCAEDAPPFLDGYRPSPTSLEFFHSDDMASSGGYVRRITIWDRTLTDIEAAKESGCRLSKPGKTCEATVTEVIPYERTRYSGSWTSGPPGTGFLRGQLGSLDGWCADGDGSWIDLDTGLEQSIVGVVTQGRAQTSRAASWVTAYKVMVSTDGVRYSDVQCGSVFTANTDKDTMITNNFAVPVSARYVRVFPQEWENNICMRVGVVLCERPCRKDLLDYQFQENYDSSNDGPALIPAWGYGTWGLDGLQFAKNRGLQLDDSRCITGDAYTVAMQVKFASTADDIMLMTSGDWDSTGASLSISEGKFKFLPSGTGLECGETIRQDTWYKLAATRSDDGTVAIFLNGFKCKSGNPPYAQGFKLDNANIQFFRDPSGDVGTFSSNGAGVFGTVKRLRIWGKAMSEDDVASMNGCRLQRPARKNACANLVTVDPVYADALYSSVKENSAMGTGYAMGRLNSGSGFAPARAQKGEWMQLDLSKVRDVQGIVIKPYDKSGRTWKLLAFKVMTSVDGKKWDWVQCGRIFDGNSATDDRNTEKQNLFVFPVKARYVRIVVEDWQNRPGFRAGVLACEAKCVAGMLQYSLHETLLSDTEGPALTAPWSEAGWNDNLGYRFTGGKGLRLSEDNCVPGPAWSVVIRARLDAVNGYRRLIDSPTWGDYGLYIHDGVYVLFAGTDILSCRALLYSDQFHTFGVTRDDAGHISMYLDGYMCGSALPSELNHFQLENEITFFKDESTSENPQGYVRKIQMWDYAVPPQQMAEIAGWSPPTSGTPCSLHITYLPPYTRISYSSTYDNAPSGYAWGRGRLNSPYGWHPYMNRYQNQYMQIDMGQPTDIVGVVTQGRGNNEREQWVKAYSVAVSDDGASWKDVEGGANFPANTNRDDQVFNVFSEPVQARYLRILPQEWNGVPCMRAALLLCEKPCVDGELDYPLQEGFASETDGPSLGPIWGIGNFEVRHAVSGYRFPTGKGLRVLPASCIKAPESYSVIVQAMFDNAAGWNRIIDSDRWSAAGLFVKGNRYMIMPSDLGIQCSSYIFNNRLYQFGLTVAESGDAKLYINGFMCATGSASDAPGSMKIGSDALDFFHDSSGLNGAGLVSRIRLFDKALSDSEMTRMCLCKLPDPPTDSTCLGTVVLNVEDSKIRFDSNYYSRTSGQDTAQGRLNSASAWVPANDNDGHWIQYNTGKVQTILGVVTQGYPSWNRYTTSFKVKVSQDGRKWRWVQCGNAFPGNEDTSTQVRTVFDSPVLAQFVRIYPEANGANLALRAAVLVCEQQCDADYLNYQFRESLASDTGGPTMQATWGLGSFSATSGYAFQAGEGLELDGHNCLKDAAQYAIQADVMLVSTGAEYTASIISSSSWRDNGVYVVNGVLQLKPTGMRCVEQIRSGYFYKVGLTRKEDGTVSLFLNGYLCGEGKPTSNRGFQLDLENLRFARGLTAAMSPSGALKRVQVWGKSMTGGEMQSEANCVLPDAEAACERTNVFVPSQPRWRFSSVYVTASLYRNLPRLGERGFLSNYKGSDPNQWLQVDAGKEISLSGLITTGMYDGHYTKVYKVSVSVDGFVWKWVECGRMFNGNTDNQNQVRTIFQAPVKARYVRVYAVETSHGYMGMTMGLLVCEEPCVGNRVDYRLTDQSLRSVTGGPSLNVVGSSSWISAGGGYNIRANTGLSLDPTSCLTNGEEYSFLVNAKLTNAGDNVPIIVAAEWGSYGLYVSDHKLMLKPSSTLVCSEYIFSGQAYQFGLTHNKDREVTLSINGYPCKSGTPVSADGFPLQQGEVDIMQGPQAKGALMRLQIWQSALSQSEMLSKAGCVLPPNEPVCNAPVVYSPDAGSFRASLTYDNAQMGDTNYGLPSLDSTTSWRGDQYVTANMWLQLDSGEVQTITGVVTQGHRSNNYWVTSYKVSVSRDGYEWLWVECGRMFEGNKDRNTKVTNLFDKPVEARYVRVYPASANVAWAVRLGVVTCEKTCKSGLLDWSPGNSLQSVTGGPNLDAISPVTVHTWLKDGTRVDDGVDTCRFTNGFEVDSSRCISSAESWTLVMAVRLDTMTGFRALLTATDWGESGLYIKDSRLYLRPSGLRCEELLTTYHIYQYGMRRTSDGNVTLFINGYPCARGNPVSAHGFALDAAHAVFLHSDNNQDSNGYLERIRLWNSAITDDEMLSATKCPLAALQRPCANSVDYRPGCDRFRFSETVSGYQPCAHSYYTYAGLDEGGYGWRAPSYKGGYQGNWMQIDAVAVQKIVGVIYRGNQQNYFSQYLMFRVSDDGQSWRDVQCGQVFDSEVTVWNQEKRVTFDAPVQGRYLRVYWDRVHYQGGKLGLILCERECEGGHLEYDLRKKLGSQTEGPSLARTSNYALGLSSVTGFPVTGSQNRQLKLTASECIRDRTQYTIQLTARVDAGAMRARSGWMDARRSNQRKEMGMITSQAWNNMGGGAWIAEGLFQLYPANLGLRCAEDITDGEWYKFGLKRESNGNVTLYLNGYPCGTRSTLQNDRMLLPAGGDDASGDSLFFEKGGPNFNGDIMKVEVWQRALTDKQMMALNDCILAPQVPACARSYVYSPDSSLYRSSGQYNGYGLGSVSNSWAYASLPSISAGDKNSNYAWCGPGGGSQGPGTNGDWLSVDIGREETVKGVVTRGSTWGNYAVTAFEVQVSNDGVAWASVECGRQFYPAGPAGEYPRYQDGLRESVFEFPVKARYVKVWVRNWSGRPCMTMGVLICQAQCAGQSLKYDFTKDSLESSTGGPAATQPWGTQGFKDNSAGLDLISNRGVWVDQDACLTDPSEYTVQTEVVFDAANGRRPVILAPQWGGSGLWLDQYRLVLRGTELECSIPIRPQFTYWLAMRRTSDGEVAILVNGNKCTSGTTVVAGGFKLDTDGGMDFFHKPSSASGSHADGTLKSIQMWQQAKSNAELQEVIGCVLPQAVNQTCARTVRYSPSNNFFTSNPAPINADYNYPQLGSMRSFSFSSNTITDGMWLQVDAGEERVIMGVATQGREDSSQWVDAYKVSVSSDGFQWADVDCGLVFEGNSDRSTIKDNLFKRPLRARYVRLRPVERTSYVSLRMGLLLCEEQCANEHLRYDMVDLMSTTGGPNLQAPWGLGTFVDARETLGLNANGGDISYYSDYLKEACIQACKDMDGCVAATMEMPNDEGTGVGCWLKHAAETPTPDASKITWFNVNTLYYKAKQKYGYYLGGSRRGLELDPASCLTETSEYTLLMEARLDTVSNTRAVFSADEWGQYGAVVQNGKFGLSPAAAGLVCEDWVIDTDYFYKFAMSRARDGTVSLFLNGVKCAEGMPRYRGGFALDPHSVEFLHDSNSAYDTNGWIRQIQVWGKALSVPELADACQCPSPPMSNATCAEATPFEATAADVDFSSTRSRAEYGAEYGSGWDVDGQNSWWADSNRPGKEWIQIDLGKVDDVAGIVTRGSYRDNHMVTAYVIRVSNDQTTWTGVDCAKVVSTPYQSSVQRRDNDVERYFSAPIRARYVRLYPMEYRGHPKIRMQVLTCVPPPPPQPSGSEGGSSDDLLSEEGSQPSG